MSGNLILERLGKWGLHICAAGGFILGLVAGLYIGISFSDSKSIKGLQVIKEWWGFGVPGDTDAVLVQRSTDQEYIFVDLSGAVVKPNVYKLLPDSRIADLLKVGEGITNEASAKWLSKNVNLSQKLSDGDKVYVPFEWEVTEDLKLDVSPLVSLSESKSSSDEGKSEETDSTGSETDNSSGEKDENDMKINVNSATTAELEGLPGIGPVTASRIINNRPYTDINNLKDRAKISNSVMEKIKDFILF